MGDTTTERMRLKDDTAVWMAETVDARFETITAIIATIIIPVTIVDTSFKTALQTKPKKDLELNQVENHQFF